MNSLVKIIAAFMSLLAANPSFAQMPLVTFGTLDTGRVSVEEFNAQKDLKIEKGYLIDSAEVIFGGANFPSLRQVRIFPEYDSVLFSELRALVAPGSVVYFQVYGKDKATRRPFRKDFNYIFYGGKKAALQPPSASTDNPTLRRY